MPKTYDGNKNIREKSNSPVASEKSVASKISPPNTKLRGFVAVPNVSLQRINITPYLNGSKKRKNGLKRGYTNFGPHSLRLSQKCTVNVIRNDLEKLKATLKSSEDTDDSDTDDTMSEMTLKCSICSKNYNSEKKLQKHLKNKHIIFKNTKTQKRVSFSDHVIIHEVKEYHKCRKCPKIFEGYELLRTHMRKRHRKRKCYICNYCEKSFADRMFFKVHIRLHCDVCGQLFHTKSTYMDHRKYVCKVYKLYKCKTCTLSFFKVMDVKDHSYEHGKPCYVCDICKEQFDNKCGIAHHLSYLHSKKRPTSLYETHKVGNERLYICNFCEDSSVEKDIIEKHGENLPDLSNRAMTGYKDYYFCDQCMRHFKTETEMLNHKWMHYLNNLDQKPSPKSILKKDDKENNTRKLTLNNGIIPTDEKTEKKTKFNIKELPRLPKAVILLERIKPCDKDVDENKKTSEHKITESELKIIETEHRIIETEHNITEMDNEIEMDDDADFVNNFLEVEYSNKKSKTPHLLRSRKTLISNFQCENCGKYFSSNYCLNRHVKTLHRDYENLRCNVCEETFVWPSLLDSHKCIRMNIPEMPFEDARPEIQFDNTIDQIDDLDIETDNYSNAIDFEIPAPVVEVRECDSTFNVDNLQNLGYRVVMQEVPIEF